MTLGWRHAGGTFHRPPVGAMFTPTSRLHRLPAHLAAAAAAHPPREVPLSTHDVPGVGADKLSEQLSANISNEPDIAPECRRRAYSPSWSPPMPTLVQHAPIVTSAARSSAPTAP